jgi:hypothetical protein
VIIHHCIAYREKEGEKKTVMIASLFLLARRERERRREREERRKTAATQEEKTTTGARAFLAHIQLKYTIRIRKTVKILFL